MHMEIKQLDIESFNDCFNMDTNMTRNPSVNKDLIYFNYLLKQKQFQQLSVVNRAGMII